MDAAASDILIDRQDQLLLEFLGEVVVGAAADLGQGMDIQRVRI